MRMLVKIHSLILIDRNCSLQVHADIKPDNLILVNNKLKVTDLSLAFPVSSIRMAEQQPVVRGTLGELRDYRFSLNETKIL
jgi:hypothetical protein